MRLGEVARTWLPLAASWLVMGLEMPVVSAIIARLADPEVHLAAYGGVVFPVSMLVEAPVIMLLSASVALAKDAPAARLIYRFMMLLSAALTVLHALLAFTPLFDYLVIPLLGPPEAVVEPARIGLRIMLPWTWAIGYRRYHQGLLIRYGRSHHVSIGTGLRLLTVGVTAGVAGPLLGAPGIVAASAAIAAGVTVEAVYSALAALPVVRTRLAAAPAGAALTLPAFLTFYLPLVLTGMLSLFVQPIGSAAIARMPDALASLAVWPVANGFLFMIRSVAFALNAVVVALLDRPGAYRALLRFTQVLAAAMLAISLAVAFTPLSGLWFGSLSGLGPELTALATLGFAWALLMPPLDAYRNFIQGLAVFAKRTAAVSSSMILFLAVSAALLAFGIVTQRFTALPMAMLAFAAATAAQVAWLWAKVRREAKELAAR